MKKEENIPHLRLVQKIEESNDQELEDDIFKFKGISGLLEKKGLTWSTILIIGSSSTLLILFIVLGITVLISV
jgi:hypothetical protein